jgi:hypothetical protein
MSCSFINVKFILLVKHRLNTLKFFKRRKENQQIKKLKENDFNQVKNI